MSEYLKMKADVDNYIGFYNTEKTIYKLEKTTAEFEEKKALKEICEILEGLSLTKDTCYIKGSSDWNDLVHVYFEGYLASTLHYVKELFVREEIGNYRANLERALRIAANDACRAVPAEAGSRFNKYVDIIMAGVTDTILAKLKDLATRIEDAQAKEDDLYTDFIDVKYEGRDQLYFLACAWCNEVEFTKGMTVAVENRSNSLIEDRVIKSITYPRGVKTLRFEGTSSIVNDMQRIVPSRTFLLNNPQYADFAKEVNLP